MQLLDIFPSCPVALHSPDQQCGLELQDQMPWLTRFEAHPFLTSCSVQGLRSRAGSRLCAQRFAHSNALSIRHILTRNCSSYGLHSAFSSAMPLRPKPGHAVLPYPPIDGPLPLPTGPDRTISAWKSNLLQTPHIPL